jgi:hypothetical protein
MSFKAEAGHHLAPKVLSSGRNVFEELGEVFTLLAFDADDRAVRSLEDAARATNVPLKVVRDTYDGGREQYASRLVLVRPDQYVAWASDAAPSDVQALFARVAGQ